jgi:hypothetical protein
MTEARTAALPVDRDPPPAMECLVPRAPHDAQLARDRRHFFMRSRMQSQPWWLLVAGAIAAGCSDDVGTPDASPAPDVAADVDGIDKEPTPDAALPDATPDRSDADDAGEVTSDVTSDVADDADPTDVTPDVTPDDAPDAEPTDAAPDAPGDVVCATGQTFCGGACVDLTDSVAHCGACGSACAAGQVCSGGACRMPCEVGQTRCGAACVDVQTSAAHCGACGAACPAGAMCVAGACVTCAAPRAMCGAACVDPQTDPSHCGACDRACPVGEACVAGACGCATGQTRCGATCVDTATDDNHCGACGTGCPTGQRCVAGACACPTGQTRCGAVCVDATGDAMNCGACGRACGAAQRCEAGACACPTGLTACGTGCADTAADVAHCGGCGVACATGQSCAMGVCACPAGQTVCGADAAARCLNTATDTAHCGACGRACAAGQSCVGGVCAAVPSNDRRAGAIVLSLDATSTTVTADTTGAAHDAEGPAGCSCTAGRDVFYTFTLEAEEIVYADTLDGQTWDSSLFLQDAAGDNVAAQSDGFATCSDDACGTRRSQLAARLPAGTWYLVVSGCAQGAATVRFQHLPVGSGDVEAITPSGTRAITSSLAAGTGRVNPGCDAAGPEDTFWWTTCPSFLAQPMHITTCGGAAFDTVIHQHSAGRSPVSLCNDDACGFQSNLLVTLPAGAGLHAYYLDVYGASLPGAYTVRHAFGACLSGWGVCGPVCLDLQTDGSNCGACGRACAGGQTCQAGACRCPAGQTLCGATCRDTLTDDSNCGACGATCAVGAGCAAGRCIFGEGNAPLNVTSGTVTLNAVAASVSGARGAMTVTLSNPVGGRAIAAGDRLVLHQTQAATGPVGFYEYRRVMSVSGATATLDAPLDHAYATDATARAQAVVVAEYADVTVAAGARLTARAWDGNSGGILALDATGEVTVDGSIHANGIGFRGRNHPCPYRCARGYQGESALGLGGVDLAANGAGGGGGGRGQDDGAGGGGAYGESGTPGPDRVGCGTCAECVAGAIPGGEGGTPAGAADLSTVALFGAAGGEGGADEDGGNPGAGGHGGGILLIRSGGVTLGPSGAIQSNGANGAGGNQSACGGSGCGMGGGGGGAGGAVRLISIGPVALGVHQVRATGGLGGGATCGSTSGGSGSVGRVGVLAGTISGSTLPLFTRN